MNKYRNLLLSIANRYQIHQGKNESTEEWKARVIYSICGLMAYASLWDEVDEEAVSITHLKHRIRSIFESYSELFPEIVSLFPLESCQLEDEISEVFNKSGVIYHKPNRISPSKTTYSSFDEVRFCRGICIDDIKYISGVGIYEVNSPDESLISVDEMFQLNEQRLKHYWDSIVKNARWSVSDEFQSNTEYLKMEAPFTKGYWINNPYKTGCISLLRTGIKGSEIYYLYRYNGSNLEISPLSIWMVEDKKYRSVSCACLHSYNALPAIDYIIDGSLVHLYLNYLLPPRELNWLKLYTWPETIKVLPSDFKRKCSYDIFVVIQKILTDKGYSFNER